MSVITFMKNKSKDYVVKDNQVIIVDEFIDNQTPYTDFFFYLCDSMSTIFRKRLGCKVFLLANTIDSRSVWFSEQGIMSDVSRMKIGDRKICQRDNMTPVYFEIVANSHTSAKAKFIDSYFNFRNPKLNSITGTDTWSYSQFPIFQRSGVDSEGNAKRYNINKHLTFYIKHNGFYLQCQLVVHEVYGVCVLCRNWNIEPHKDDIVLVKHTPENQYEHNFKEYKIIFKKCFCELWESSKWYFRDNSTAMTFMSFVNDK